MSKLVQRKKKSCNVKEVGNNNEYEAEYYKVVSPQLIFEKTEFSGPTTFHRTDLSRTRFQLVDLSNISFLNSQIKETRFISCTWGSGAEASKFFYRLSLPLLRIRRPRILFDELLLRKKKNTKKKQTKKRINKFNACWKYLFGERLREEKKEPIDEIYIKHHDYRDLSPGDVQVLALQLKQSLEATKDPIAAGDFHFAAMEMKQWMAKDDKRWFRAGALWLYKMVNGYGERYGRTMMWIVWLVALSTAAYMLFCDFAPTEANAYAYQKPGFWAHLLYACQNILPLKFAQLYIEPCCQLGRWLSFIETFLGTTLFTFMVLALRRRFKR